jgi:hypothetical protein
MRFVFFCIVATTVSLPEIVAPARAQTVPPAPPPSSLMPDERELEAIIQSLPPPSERELKERRCRNNQRALIGLDRTHLRERCGMWNDSSQFTTADGSREQLIWSYRGIGAVLVVYLENGIVVAVQAR